MSQITSTELPKRALLRAYAADLATHTDCYLVNLPKHVSLEQYINAFFDTWLFRIERLILRVALGKPSRKKDIANLANGSSNILASWRLEQRDDDQILLEVPETPIRTWLMRSSDGAQTQLFFGSAVLPTRKDREGKPAMAAHFRVFMGFHRLYARALLYTASRKLR